MFSCPCALLRLKLTPYRGNFEDVSSTITLPLTLPLVNTESLALMILKRSFKSTYLWNNSIDVQAKRQIDRHLLQRPAILFDTLLCGQNTTTTSFFSCIKMWNYRDYKSKHVSLIYCLEHYKFDEIR